ncbi:T-complex 11 [Hypoxylon sp. NC1633]|nr:T-complex 11 [Hypoxylon sp. NC1633]
MGDEGAGGLESRGVENNTTRRMSGPRKNSHDGQIQQQSAEAKTPTPETDEPQYTQNGQDGPRHLGPVNPGNAPEAGGLSRNPSTSSHASCDSQPMADMWHWPRTSRPLDPPVTKATLSELDVAKIVHNPKLRHDINFDPDLHFRPNVDGEKGKRKHERANHFWSALEEQLQLFVVDREEFMRRFGEGDDWCLPLLLKSVKEIIHTLVPGRDHDCLDEGMDVELIMQQFNKGMADLEKLASWLSGVLKSHCAPMRDEWVDEMYNQLTNGNKTNDMEELVQGMRSLLSVLEAMKLDVANHQIRCLRPILIEDTVNFEQRFFLKKIGDGKMDIRVAYAWYLDLVPAFSGNPVSVEAFGDMGVFFEALSKLMLPSGELYMLPETFMFDQERIAKIRADMLDAINLEICMRMYEALERKHRIPDPFSDISETAMASRSLLDIDQYVTNSRMGGNESELSLNPPSSPVFGSASTDSSPPDTSFVIPPEAQANQPSLVQRQAKWKFVASRLVALLGTSSILRTASRWKSMRHALALEILRNTRAPTKDLHRFDRDLSSHLSNFSSPLYRQAEEQYHYRFYCSLSQRVKDFSGLTGAGLFSVATGGRLQGTSRTMDGPREGVIRDRSPLEREIREAREQGGVEDLATRVAHMGLLHWRVWSQLAYTGDLESLLSEPDSDVPMRT